MFRIRNFISLSLLVGFIGSAGSGLILYLRPEGGLARWVGWHFLWLDKKQWEGAHTALVAVTVIVAAMHIAYNWKPLAAYLGKKAGAVRRSYRELAAALLGMAVLFFVAANMLPPVSWLVDLRAEIKDGRFIPHAKPPVQDADRLTVEAFSEVCTLSKEALITQMRQRGIVADTTMRFGEIAAHNGLSPEDLYVLITQHSTK